MQSWDDDVGLDSTSAIVFFMIVAFFIHGKDEVIGGGSRMGGMMVFHFL